MTHRVDPAPLLLAAGLLAKEEGIAACAYLLAYGLVLDPAGARRGCLALLPYAGVVVAWLGLRDACGYGVAHIGLYIDPIGEPLRFAAAAAGRAPVLLLGQWGLPRRTWPSCWGRRRGRSCRARPWASSRGSPPPWRRCCGGIARRGSGRWACCSLSSRCARQSRWTGC